MDDQYELKMMRRRLKVFLCHASHDKPAIRELYVRLKKDNVKPWLDEENLLPGQLWAQEIPKAVRESDAILVCLSHHSITKEGYVQKEIKLALDTASEKPDGTIFLVPVRLEKCDVPERLRTWHYVDLWIPTGYKKLLRSLVMRAKALGLVYPHT